MKKTPTKPRTGKDDEMLPEYDFSGGVRGKYAKRLREEGYRIRVHHEDGTYSETIVPPQSTIVLEPDVQQFFPDSKSVNHALRTLIALVHAKPKGAAKKAARG